MPVHLGALATGSLAFTLALAWNDALGKIVRRLAPGGDGIFGSVAYAVVVTILVVGIVVAVGHAQRLAGAAKGASAAAMGAGAAAMGAGAAASPAHPAGRSQGFAAAPPPDCTQCLKHCWVGSVVRF